MGVLDGRVAIVTGGGRGIGAAIARRYAAEGALLVVNDLGGDETGEGHDTGPADEVVQEITAGGGRAVADHGDVSAVETGERLTQLALDHYGKLDILVNVAGILRDKMIFNLEEKDWDAVIRVHLKGHYSTIRAASRYWRQQRNRDGNYRIINFTSGSALHGSPGQPNYAAAKMGVVGLTMSLANALARYGVTANAISPAASTRLVATVPEDRQITDVPSQEGDALSPDHVAPAAVFLGSTESSWLSGRVIAAGGDEVAIYNVPETIATVKDTAAMDYRAYAAAVESFRPFANGLVPSMFAAQLNS
jgi:NAD(P)-dependent dehydrogenase (short-subunit alcohol dehydrogenase family)